MVNYFQNTIKDNFRKYKKIMQEFSEGSKPSKTQNFGILVKISGRQKVLQNKLLLEFLGVS